ncbi:hypothetical protein N665_0333s0005 [Sinapis alba]|nr:hypothetical protein N665_0333s0005 [Sinapis alba]
MFWLTQPACDGHCPVGDEEEGAPDEDCSIPVVVVRSIEERISRHEVMEGEIRRLTPFRYNRDRLVEQVPDLPSERSRRAIVEGQEWADVFPTCSILQSVSSLLKRLKAYGVTFIIPRSDQRPWSPPVGYQCVYESFFGEDSKLWIPIPRLIISYCYRRDIALSQLMNGAVCIAVALMVMAVGIDVSISVRVFEEITQTQPKPNGLFAVQTRQHKWGDFDRRRIRRQRQRISKGSNLLTRQFFYACPLTDALLFSVPYWVSDVPCRESKGKRLRLPTMGKNPREYPNYNEILGPRLGGEGLHSMGEAEKAVNEAPIPTVGAPDPSVKVTEVMSGGTESTERGKRKARSVKKKKNKPAKKPRLSPQHDEEPIAEVDGGEGRSPSETRGSPGDNRSPGPVPDDEDGDRTLSPRGSPVGERGVSTGSKRKELPAESAQEPGDGRRDSVDCLVPPHRAFWDGKTPPTKKPPIVTSEAVNFRYNGDTPLVNNIDACGELIRQIRGGGGSGRCRRFLTLHSPTTLILKFFRVRSSARSLTCLILYSQAMARKNLLVLEYELALRKVVVELIKAEETIRTKDGEFEKTKKDILEKAKRVVAERNLHYHECKQAVKKAAGLEADLEAARVTIARLEKEKSEEVDRAKKEIDRLRRSRFHEVACEKNRVMSGMTLKCNHRFNKFRKYMVDRDSQESKLFLHRQASGMLQSMDLLKKWGLQVPQILKDILTEDEARFRKEAEEAEVEEINDQDFVLSPLRIESLFGFDQFGSNLGTVDSTTAASLRSPAPKNTDSAAGSLPSSVTRQQAIPTADVGAAEAHKEDLEGCLRTTGGGIKPIVVRFDRMIVRSFASVGAKATICAQLACLPLPCVFEHLAENQVIEFQWTHANLLIVIGFDKMLIVLDTEQRLIPSFFDRVQGVKQHLSVEFCIERNFCPSQARNVNLGWSHSFDSIR